jgi:hypothetical protein
MLEQKAIHLHAIKMSLDEYLKVKAIKKPGR